MKEEFKYYIMKCKKEASILFEAIRDKEVVVQRVKSDYDTVKYDIIVPFKLCDYDDYFVNSYGRSCFDYMGDYKGTFEEYIKDSFEGKVQTKTDITNKLDDFEFIRECTEKDMKTYLYAYNTYFKG